MMRGWSALNVRGRILFCCCGINLLVAMVFIFENDLAFIFSLLTGMFCGLATFDPRYSKK
jgi:hypothetical protein